jgi:RNA polymerase sigma factor for flagellar operon FliA
MPSSTQRAASLWSQYAARRTTRNRQKLIEHYLPVVQRIARQMQRNLPREVQLDDLISAGSFGLIYAIGTFDPSRGASFETFGAKRIRGAILDWLRSMDFVSRQARRHYNQISRAQERLRQSLHRNPSDQELRESMNVPDDTYARVARHLRTARTVSLSGPVRQHDRGEAVDAMEIADPAYQAWMRGLQRNDLRAMITRGLSTEQRLIIVLYYYEDLSMREIGDALGISESRVSQLHKDAVEQLRARFSGRERELNDQAA